MLNNILRPRKPDPTNAAARPGPGAWTETRRGRKPSAEQTAQQSQWLCPMRRGRMSRATILTPDRQLGPIAEHAHGGAPRLWSSHDRGRSRGAEQMKTELFGNCYSITPNACMLKRDPADGDVRSPAKNEER
ncbi:hypothetical protein NDU88_001394 [Pleurodeles waltl]|uniref:Uncharacterized protein n=1 Tax=Pleurodeles waltl TaxID=8319 RepID=A0AAV7WKD2_PLEWA|nr:hypothetical protein NDU88_001394 [Pleurodeles waltl]